MTTNERQCTKCGQFWPRTAEYWHVEKHHSDGLRSECKECRCEYARKRHKKNWQNPEYRKHHSEQAKRYWKQSPSREARKLKMRRYRQEKLDVWRQYDRDRWQDPKRKAQNRAAVEKRDAKIAADPVLKEHKKIERRINGQNWARTNPHKVKAKTNNRRARKRAAEGFFTDTDLQRITREQDGKCYWCGGAEKLTVDHHIPLSRGGTNWPSNLVMACHSCNSGKCDRLPIEYRRLLARREGASAPSPTLT